MFTTVPPDATFRANLGTAVGAIASGRVPAAGYGDRVGSWLNPTSLVDEITINDAAGADATLVGLLVVVGLAAVVVLPALAYLLWLTQTEEWTRSWRG